MNWSGEEETLSLREMVELLREKVDGIEEKFRAVEKAKGIWRLVGTGIRGHKIVRYYLSGAGEFVEVPETFVLALGKPLDAAILQDAEDPEKLVVRRGDQIEFRLPKGLLLFLARGRNGEVGLPANPSSCPDEAQSET